MPLHFFKKKIHNNLEDILLFQIPQPTPNLETSNQVKISSYMPTKRILKMFQI